MTIYALLDPRTEAVRYVGRAKDPDARYRAHVGSPQSLAMQLWIGALREENLRPTLQILETCDDLQADVVETAWIKRIARAQTLINGQSQNRDWALVFAREKISKKVA